MKVDDVMEPNSCAKKTLTALWKEIEAKDGDASRVKTMKQNIKNTC